MPDKPISSRLVESLVQARESAGLSQTQLASLLEVRPSTINAIERGRKNTTAKMLDRWAVACGAELMVAKPQADDVLSLAHLSEDRRQLVRELVEILPLVSDDAAAGLEGHIGGVVRAIAGRS